MSPLFKRTSIISGRFVLWAFLSLALYTTDRAGLSWTNSLRLMLSVPTQSIEWFAIKPWAFLEEKSFHWGSQETLIQENQALKEKNALLSAKMQRWETLNGENQELHRLIDTKPYINGHVTGALILQKNPTLGEQTLLINKGHKQGVFIGQVILDAHGFLGQVIRVDYQRSLVLLSVDSKSAIPVTIMRTGDEAIANGAGKLLQLNHLTKTADIRIGDKVITSHLGKVLPAGYPVGTVSYVNHKTSSMFCDIKAIPKAFYKKDHVVLLLWPSLSPISHIPTVPSLKNLNHAHKSS